jgi:hypothetical protein
MQASGIINFTKLCKSNLNVNKSSKIAKFGMNFYIKNYNNAIEYYTNDPGFCTIKLFTAVIIDVLE